MPAQPSVPWYDTQLNFTGLSQINQGTYVRPGVFDGIPFKAGDPVTIAEIDSGVNTKLKGNVKPNPVFQGADVDKTVQVEKWQYDDCVGHGTSVASLIVGQPGRSRLVGIAPRVHLIPYQYISAESNDDSTDLQTALTWAIARHPRIINMSLQLLTAPGPAIMGLLEEAEKEHIVIVAAGGNDNGQGKGQVYPAALSHMLSNIIAVSAVGPDGLAADFGINGSYIDIAAPGVMVPVGNSYGGATVMKGTSFAAPLVAGTVALMLATHPTMQPRQVRDRLEATAVPPPGTQPNDQYGWGEINPMQAVTSQRDDLLATPPPTTGRPLAAPRPVTPPDRSLQHRALAIAFGLLGLAALTVTGAAVLRGNRRAHRQHG